MLLMLDIEDQVEARVLLSWFLDYKPTVVVNEILHNVCVLQFVLICVVEVMIWVMKKVMLSCLNATAEGEFSLVTTQKLALEKDHNYSAPNGSMVSKICNLYNFE